MAPRALSDEIAFSAVAAAPLHAVYGWLVQVLYLDHRSDLTIDLRSTAMIVLGQFGDKSQLLEPTIASIADHASPIILYFIGLYACSIVAGFVAHAAVSKIGWVRNGGFFAFNSHWHQVFTGEHYFGSAQTKANFCVVSALVDLGKDTYLYRGLLRGPEDLVFDANGEIDLMLLFGAMRRKMSDDKTDSESPPDERFYPIDGDLFVLRYAHTKTLNLNYGMVDVGPSDREPR